MVSMTMFGVTPLLLISVPDGDMKNAVVSLIAPFPGIGIIVCKDPFPLDFSPTSTALLLSERAAATISAPDAVLWSINTTSGFWFVMSGPVE